MAQPDRVEPVDVAYRYRGQKKVHRFTYYRALVPEADVEAARLNESVADELAEYNGACETGTAVIV